MLNFFTTSNGFRSTLPVVSNLTAMNVWDGVCMCFIYASLLEFVCVNYVGRKRPLHNVVYRPGENPVTQVKPLMHLVVLLLLFFSLFFYPSLFFDFDVKHFVYTYFSSYATYAVKSSFCPVNVTRFQVSDKWIMWNEKKKNVKKKKKNRTIWRVKRRALHVTIMETRWRQILHLIFAYSLSKWMNLSHASFESFFQFFFFYKMNIFGWSILLFYYMKMRLCWFNLVLILKRFKHIRLDFLTFVWYAVTTTSRENKHYIKFSQNSSLGSLILGKYGDIQGEVRVCTFCPYFFPRAYTTWYRYIHCIYMKENYWVM